MTPLRRVTRIGGMASHDIPQPGAPDVHSVRSSATPLEEARDRATRLLTHGCAYEVINDAEFEWRLDQLMRAENAADVAVKMRWPDR